MQIEAVKEALPVQPSQENDGEQLDSGSSDSSAGTSDTTTTEPPVKRGITAVRPQGYGGGAGM